MQELQTLIGNPIFIGFMIGLFVGYKTAKGTLASMKFIDLKK